MASDPYSQAFQQAKSENVHAEDTRQAEREAARTKFATESEADIAALKEIVLPELYKADRSLKPSGGTIDVQTSIRADGKGTPIDAAFRVADLGDFGRTSWFYVIDPKQGAVIVTRTNTLDHFNKDKKYEVISNVFKINKREDLTVENIQKLILAAIKEYQEARPRRLR